MPAWIAAFARPARICSMLFLAAAFPVRVASEPAPAAPPESPRWKVLVLVCPRTDFAYTNQDQVRCRLVATLTEDEQQRAVRQVQRFFDEDVPALSGGLQQPVVTVRILDRTLTRLESGSGHWPGPDSTAADTDPRFDSVVVLWKGTGTNPLTGQTVTVANAGGLAVPRGTGPTYCAIPVEYLSADHRNVFKHEWGHSVLFYFDAAGITPKPAVDNHINDTDTRYVHWPEGTSYVLQDETEAQPIPNSIYHNHAGFTRDYFRGETATAGEPRRRLGITAEAWAAGGPVTKARPAPGTPSAIQPIELRCEYADDPSGIDVPQPRLSWALAGRERGARQTAFQITAASSPERLHTGEPDLWDSGKVPFDETLGLRYAGKPLSSSQSVGWRVRVWDQEGRVSDWSAPATWTAGVLSPADWQAQWITSPPSGRPPEGLPLLRKTFTTPGPVQRAVVHVSGLGHYDLFLDGQKVGNRFLDPAWSVYERTVYYSTFDVTAALRNPGDHTFAVMLGKGFYNTAGDRRVHGVTANRPLKLILQAKLTLEDGSEQWIVSDASWRTAEGPITHSAILGGEDFDARRLPSGWTRPEFDDSSWLTAVETDGPGGILTAALAPPMAEHDLFKARRIDEPAPGVFVYDFGQNASAIPRLRVRGQAGQSVRIVTAEQRAGMSPRRNDGRGLVNQAGVGTPHFSTYTLRGGGTETWAPQFYYSGFQYAQVEGAVPADRPNPDGRPVVEELVSVHVRNRAPRVGHFECSNPLFNAIDRTIDWAVVSNFAHVLTDCPHREKLGWLEVSYLMGPSIAGRYDIDRFYAKVARDCADSQRPDGQVPTVAPAYPRFEGGFDYTPEWGAAAVVVPWLLHEWYGDDAALAASYPTMRRFVGYLEHTAKDLVPTPGLGDWYDYGHGKPVGASQFTPTDLSAMATFQRCAKIVADTAQGLGRSAESAHYARLSERITAAFNGRWFDGQAEYRNSGSPQTANAMALVMDMVPTDRRGAVLERMVEDLRRRGNQQTAGDIGHAYLLRALAEGGRSDVIFDLTARTHLGSYGFIVGNGWTSMPEAWDADTGASMNHCMLGHIQEWFLGWVAGIRPDPETAGFRRFHIDPHPVGDLVWARGRFESVRGRITSAWNREDGAFRLEVTIPANTQALVSVPTRDPPSVTEGGQPAASAPGVTFLRKENGRVRFLVEAGDYTFRAPR